jgi:hypothetical protein
MGAPFSTAKSYDNTFMLPTSAAVSVPCNERMITRSMAAVLEQSTRLDPGFELGDDILCEIFKFLSSKDLVMCLAACRHWQRIADDPRLWQALCQVSLLCVPCSLVGALHACAMCRTYGGERHTCHAALPARHHARLMPHPWLTRRGWTSGWMSFAA